MELTLVDILGENGNHLGGEYDDRIEAPDRYNDSAIEWLQRCNALRIPMANCRCVMLPTEKKKS